MLVECPEAVAAYKPGDDVKLYLAGGKIVVAGKAYAFPPLPGQILAIRDAGGLLPYARAKLEKAK